MGLTRLACGRSSCNASGAAGHRFIQTSITLLGTAIERLTGGDLGIWSLGEGLSYGPAVATERCPWRGRVLKGEVHDENAWAFGGQSGHAGLFGTAAGVLGFARGLLDGGASPATLDAIRTPVHGNRTCGWERRHPGWHGGEACSPDTIGHAGFTGAGLWVDFARGLAWTLLTNRVHPTRQGADAIFVLRPVMGEAVSRRSTTDSRPPAPLHRWEHATQFSSAIRASAASNARVAPASPGTSLA